MTVPNGTTASISDISSEFGYGTSLSNYYSQLWYRDDNSRGYFQGSGAISISDFWGKRKTSPVTSGSWSSSTPGTYQIQIPMFNVISFSATGAQGGSAGTGGSCAGGGDGGGGNPSYITGNGGATYAYGNGGGINSGAGSTGTGGFNVNSDWSQSSHYYETITIVVGAGGSGGSGGSNYECQPWFSGVVCACVGKPGGSQGASGSVSISWS